MDSAFAWSEVESIDWFPTVCLVKVADFPTYVVIPHRAFATLNEASRFFETARRYWKGEPDQAEADWPPPPIANSRQD